MKILEVLNESLDSSLPLDKTEDSDVKTVYKIRVATDSYYTVVFKFLSNDPNINGLKHYDLEFFDSNNRQGINGALGHSAIKLFSTLNKVLKDFLSRGNVAIQFSSRSYEGSRVKLYNRLISNLNVKNYETSSEQNGNYVDYYITPVHPNYKEPH